ncbi:MAG TPA: glycogen/starch synthase [Turneriella sp.]|nr:glycogen/starch synthase [Turneriella sp.]
MNIVEISSECSGLAQRGGLGSVIWGLIDAFSGMGHSVKLIIPYYAEIQYGVRMYTALEIFFGGEKIPVSVFTTKHGGADVYLIHSDRFFRGAYADVYIDSGKLGRGYFEDDAQRFAFFSLAAAHLLLHLHQQNKIDVLHAHDWHSGLVLLLTRIHPIFEKLQSVREIFTIHNLEYQGTRPLYAMGELRAFFDWYTDLAYMGEKILDPYLDPHADIACINPMRAAINTATVVTTVSPSYAEEICRPDNSVADFYGGRGLEKDLASLRSEDRLCGITNGIDQTFYTPEKLSIPYSATNFIKGRKENRAALFDDFSRIIEGMLKTQSLLNRCEKALIEKYQKITRNEFLSKPLFVAVTRLTGQKIRQFFEVVHTKTVLEHCAHLNAHFIFLGKGDLLQTLQEQTQSAHNIFLFGGFDDALEMRLYASADAMLMPSEFEPCGTSQMKAMRYGSLPIAAAVGGLKDTIQNGDNGFLYDGASRHEKATEFLTTIRYVAELTHKNAPLFHEMQRTAMATDFSWTSAAAEYMRVMVG